MSFSLFLKERGIINNRQAQELSDKAYFVKKDVYSYLQGAGGLAALEIEGDLDALLIEWGKTVNINIKRVTDTHGWECEQEVYKRAGGVNESIVSLMLPLKNKETDEHIIVMTTPTDESFLERVKAWSEDVPPSIGICDDELWEGLFHMYVQPLLMSNLAVRLSDNHAVDSKEQDVSRDSEARRFYRMLMNVGIEQNASDVHFIPCSNECQVHFRIDGINVDYMSIPKDILEKICNILKNDGHVGVKNPREAVDGKVRYSPSDGKVAGDEIDLRVSIIPSKAGSDLNVRYLSSHLYNFEELGMSPDNIKRYKALLDLPSGMVVQVGPTGSGKSTTLYTGLAYVHESLRNVMTSEDPVEILMDGISQIDVDNSEGSPMTFSDALKAALRHDPDVIVVGELRDRETAELAVRAANTGHLVLTSLHTNDSIGAFERMINMGVDSYSLGEVIAAVMGQRLVRRLCPYCKKEVRLDLKSSKAKFFGFPNQEGSIRLYEPCGCVHCNNTGYKGRVAINEILVIDSNLRNFIQKHEVRKTFEDYLLRQKFRTMYQDGLQKVIDGITSLDELYKFAADTIAFKGLG